MNPSAVAELTRLPLEADMAYEIDGQSMTAEQVRQLLSEKSQAVQIDLRAMRDEWIQYRASLDVEDKWRRSKALYDGEDYGDREFVDTLKNGPAKRTKVQTKRSRVTINIVRPKTDTAIARMCEILLPIDDMNWGIRPTPIPEFVSKMVGDQRETVIPGTNEPTGMTADGEAKAYMQAARECAEAMQDAIADPLTECHYNAEQRTLITDGAKLGCGVIFGPIPKKQCSKVWEVNGDGTSRMVYTEKTIPASERADPWDVWFDPGCGNNHQNGRGVWRRKYVTRKQLRQLVGVTGYDADAIREVLKMPPTRLSVAHGRVLRQQCREHSYELWEYHGEIEPDAMTYASLNTGDPLTDVEYGVILMVNDRVIGAMASWVDDKTIPCDVFVWRDADEHPYGAGGVPLEMENQQKVVNAAWRQVMDNARNSLGSIIVAARGIRPQNGDYTLGGAPVLWEFDPDKIADATKGVTSIDFPSHLQELIVIAEKAMQYSDGETNMPQLLGGEKGSQAPETLGGMIMQYNNANGVLRFRVKLYDDRITVPHISRHYDYQMANNPDPNIKGDNEVDARGSTALLEKDIQNQATINLATITNNPRYAHLMDPKKELALILKAFRTQPDSVMKTPAEIKAIEENPPETPPDPRVVAAEYQLEGKKLDAQVKGSQIQSQERLHAAEVELKAAQLAYNVERERAEGEQAMVDATLDREVAIAKLVSADQQSTENRASQERMQALDLDNKNQLFNAEAALRVRTGEGI
jgi:hypothetical protein